MRSPRGREPGQPPVRRYPRMAAEYVVAYRRRQPDGSESSEHLSRTRSLGLGGLMFETESPLDVGETLRLDVIVGERTVRASGTVIYAERQAEGLWRNGVQFTEISENDRDVLLGDYLQREYRIAPL